MTTESTLFDVGDTLPDLLRRAADRQPDGLFGTFNGASMTFGALAAESEAIASGLRASGVKAGDRVCLMAPNQPLAIATIFGIARAGAVWVPLNPQQRGDGLRYLMEHSRPVLYIAAEDCVASMYDALPELSADRVVTLEPGAGATSVRKWVEVGERFDAPRPSMKDPFAIMYSSGTTGRPKGIVVTHMMMRVSGMAATCVAGARGGDVLFMWEPLNHIGGVQLLNLPMTEGVTLAMVDRFSASRFWDQVRETGSTHIHFLGGILQILLKQPVSERDRDHPVRIAWGGGCPADIWRDFETRFGVSIRECYGMTEASSITTYNDTSKVGSVGRALPWFRVELIGPDGTPAAPGEKGEIVVRPAHDGPLFSGYLDNPEATAKALRGGALHTGDLGSFDEDGDLFFHGRMTDSIRVRGENVSAWEIEHVASDHPAIEDCAMIGVATDIGEQDIKLFVKLRQGATLGAQDLVNWLSTRLATYQLPRYIAFVSDFDRTPSQRIMKHVLSKRHDDCWDRRAGPVAASSNSKAE